MANVRGANVAEQPLAPVSLNDLRVMLATCERRSLTGDRDRAMLLDRAAKTSCNSFERGGR